MASFWSLANLLEYKSSTTSAGMIMLRYYYRSSRRPVYRSEMLHLGEISAATTRLVHSHHNVNASAMTTLVTIPHHDWTLAYGSLDDVSFHFLSSRVTTVTFLSFRESSIFSLNSLHLRLKFIYMIAQLVVIRRTCQGLMPSGFECSCVH